MDGPEERSPLFLMNLAIGNDPWFPKKVELACEILELGVPYDERRKVLVKVANRFKEAFKLATREDGSEIPECVDTTDVTDEMILQALAEMYPDGYPQPVGVDPMQTPPED